MKNKIIFTGNFRRRATSIDDDNIVENKIDDNDKLAKKSTKKLTHAQKMAKKRLLNKSSSIESNSSGFASSSSAKSDSNSIFYIAAENAEMDRKTRFDESKQLMIKKRNNNNNNKINKCLLKLSLPPPPSYRRHRFEDIRPLTIGERIRLTWRRCVSIPNAIRFAMVLSCVGWFALNAYTVMHEYLQFDTIVYLEFRVPQTTLPPAISICTECILCPYDGSGDGSGDGTLHRINARATLDYRNHYVYTDEDYYNDDYEDVENDTDVDVKFRCQFYPTTVSSLSNKNIFMDTTKINGTNSQFDDDIEDTMDTNEYRDCTEASPIVISMQEGKKCFTFFADIDGAMTRAARRDPFWRMKFDYFPTIEIEISGRLLTDLVPVNGIEIESETENRSIPVPVSGLFIGVHDPAKLPYMVDKPMHRLAPGRRVNTIFRKKMESLLPPPFSTRCFEYNRAATSSPPDIADDSANLHAIKTPSGLSIYRSPGECLLYCIWRTLNADRCINMHSIFISSLIDREQAKIDQILSGYVDDRPIPPVVAHMLNRRGKIRFCAAPRNETLARYLFYKTRCDEWCRQSCHVDSFDLDPNNLEAGVDIDRDTSMVQLQWAPEPFPIMLHREKMATLDFIGTFGGHAHIWLALSFIHIVRFVFRFVTGGHLAIYGACALAWIRSIARRRRS